MKQILLANVVSLIIATTVASRVDAQPFQGIITMKLSGNIVANMSGRGANAGSPPSGANAGRAGAVSSATGAPPARAGDARGAAARGADGRAGEGRAGAGRAGEARVPDPREETMRNALAGGLQQIEYMTRRGKVRIAVSGANGQPSPAAMIYVPEEGLMYTLLPPVSMYSETRMSDLQGMTQPVIDSGEAVRTSRLAVRPPAVTHTKQFELIAGHKCEHVTVTTGTTKSDICIGKGLGVFIMPAGLGRSEGWDRVLTESNGFPLRVTQANGTVTMEVVKIERKALPEALFSVPDSYTKMPEFGRRPPG